MTAQEAAELLRNAPCQLRHMIDPKTGRGRKHAAMATFSPHVRCLVAALESAGVLDKPTDTV